MIQINSIMVDFLKKKNKEKIILSCSCGMTEIRKG